MRQDIHDLPEEKCPTCGRSKSEWRVNGSSGYSNGGATYCCDGCAKGTQCTCVLRQGALPPSIDTPSEQR